MKGGEIGGRQMQVGNVCGKQMQGVILEVGWYKGGLLEAGQCNCKVGNVERRQM